MTRRTLDLAMSWLASARTRFAMLLHRRRHARDLEDELRHHLALGAEVTGAIGADASRAARRRFGNLARIQDECRDAVRFTALEAFAADVAHGVRLLRQEPAFATITSLMLAAGIGLNVWIFGTMHALLFRSVPGVAAADRAVAIGRTENGSGFDTLSYPNVEDIAARTSTLAGVAPYADRTVAVVMGDHTERVQAQLVGGAFFSVVGAPMQAGRPLSTDDGRRRAPVAVVSAGLWSRLFGDAATLDGRAIVVNRVPLTVVGIAARAFTGLTTTQRVDLWTPIGALAPQDGPPGAGDPTRSRSATWLLAVGRLRDEASSAEARTELTRIAADLAREYPDDNATRGLAVEPLGGIEPGERPALARQWLLLNSLAAVVLLVVCFNVANMLLARAAARGTEMAVRLSLGAGRMRLVRQVLAEQVPLVVLGAAGGAVLAWWTSAWLNTRLIAESAPVAIDAIVLDWRLLIVATVVAAAACAIVSVPPALAAIRTEELGRRSSTRAPARHRLRSSFVVLQVALSVALLVGAALLARSLQRAFAVDLGFDARGVVTAYYDLEPAGILPSEGARMHAQLLEHFGQRPGVERAALGLHVPLQGASLGYPIDILRDDATVQQELVRANLVSAGFFAALKTSLIRGREFTAADTEGAPLVALVNEACLRRCFGGGDPVGREIRIFRDARPRRVVGVVRDSKYAQPLEEVRPTIFLPLSQNYSPRMGLLIRTASPAAVASALAGEVGRLVPAAPIYGTALLSERLARALWLPRMMSTLVGAFGILTASLAALGVYGVVSQTSSRRTAEIAVRMALGATPGGVLRMIALQGLVLVGIGVLLGTALAATLSGALAAYLYGIGRLDAVSFAAAIVATVAAGLIACILPARRAAAMNPATVLKQ